MHPSRRLLLRHLAFRAATIAPVDTIVSTPPDGRFEASWAVVADRAARLASALRSLGVSAGEPVATMAFNDHRHLDAYLAVPCLGGVLHPVNIRWRDDEIVPVLAHTRDRIALVDATLAGRMPAILERCPWIETVVGLGDWNAADRAAIGSRAFHAHDDLVSEASRIDSWPDLDETAPMAYCSTSGTTGGPKTVAYTHRTTCLQTMALGLTDCMRLSGRDTVLAIVPMFHALGWCLPYAAAMLGARLILPHRDLAPARILDLVQEHRVTTAAAVPTIWSGVLAAADAEPDRWDLSSLDRIISGGAAPTESMIRGFRDRHGVEVIHSWGMTEINPVGTMSPAATTGEESGMAPDERLRHQTVAGRPLPGLGLEVVDDADRPVPHDGESTGRLLVSGWWVADGYLGDHAESPRFRSDGGLETGDVASIDDRGRLRIRDREKDLVKSGGEWISSLELDRAIGDLPGVAAAAVVARPDERWGERPVVCIVPSREQAAPTRESLRASLAGRFQSWQIPDAILVLDSMPLTSTGKIDKKALRAMVRDETPPGS